MVDSNWCQPTDSKNISKDETLLLIYSAAAIEYTFNKTVEKVYCKSRHKEKDIKSGVG